MFQTIISRDAGCPWGSSGKTSATWLEVPVRRVSIRKLTATQPGVLLEALIEGRSPVGGDPYPHVIDHGGRLYLEDGHHRTMKALLAGRRTIRARVLHIPSRGGPAPVRA